MGFLNILNIEPDIYYIYVFQRLMDVNNSISAPEGQGKFLKPVYVSKIFLNLLSLFPGPLTDTCPIITSDSFFYEYFYS